MAAPVPGTIYRYGVVVGGAVYAGPNVQDMKVEEKINQVPIARCTLNLTHSTVITDGGNVIVMDHTNNLPETGHVQIEDEIIQYTSRTGISHLDRLEEEWATYLSDPGGYVPTSTPFQISGLTRADHESTFGTHASGRRAYIWPLPAEGDDILIYYGGDLKFVGVVSNVERDEDSDAVDIEAVQIATRIRDIPVTTKTIYSETRSGTILETLKPPGGNWTTDIDLGVILNYRMELGNNLMHIANLCLMSGFDWWVSSDGTSHVVHCRTQRGSSIPGATFTARLTALNLKRSTSKNDIFNSITGIGSSQEMQGSSSTLNANTIRMTALTSSESTLAENINLTDATFTLVSASSYIVGDTIQIGIEPMVIIGKSSNDLTVTRGPTPAAHYVGDPVLMKTRLVVSDEEDLNQGEGDPTEVWIGSERVGVQSISGNQLNNLTRGLDSTTPYAHRAGTLVLAATDSGGDITNEDPEATSSIGYYGVRGMRQSVIGAADMDGLDKHAGQVLLELMDLLPGGSFQVPVNTFPETMGVGDTFTLLEYGVSGSANHRITGLTWDLSGAVTVEYGHPEDWILADFEDAARAMQLATQKTAPAAQAAILATSEDGKMVQVQGPDGPIWVRVTL